MDNNNNRFQDYSSPEPQNWDAQYGFAPRENGGYNLNGQYYPGGSGSYNGSAGDTNSSYGTMNNGGYNYGGGNYNANARVVPLDKKGRPLRNRFGMKLTFSILGIIFSCFLLLGKSYFSLIPLILSVMALIFACLQNKYYSEGKWDSFRSAAKTSAVFLWVDFAVWIVLIILFIIGLVAILMIGKSITDGLDIDDGNNPFSGYEYDYDDDIDDYDFYDSDIKDDDTGDVDGLIDDIDDAIGDGSVDDDNAGTDRKKDAGDATVNDLQGKHVPDVKGFNTFKLQGKKLTLPMSMEDFYNAGFYMEHESESDQIEPGQSDGYAYYDMDGNYLGTVFVYNTKASSIYAGDGVIGGLTINGRENVELSLIGGLSFESSPQDAVKVLGNDVSGYDKNDYCTYISWYFKKGGYSTSIELDFDTENKLDEVWIMNYDELE